MKKHKSKLLAFAAMLALTGSVAVAAPSSKEADFKVDEKVRKELVTLPYYGVFDNLAFKREGSTVTLYGQVVRPTTRSSAERVVEKLEGVEQVVNNIEVLPLSSFDDDMRLRTYYTVFGTGNLYRYALGANPSIHIVVNRGRVTLEGVVGNKGDAQLAFVAKLALSGSVVHQRHQPDVRPVDQLLGLFHHAWHRNFAAQMQEMICAQQVGIARRRDRLGQHTCPAIDLFGAVFAPDP